VKIHSKMQIVFVLLVLMTMVMGATVTARAEWTTTIRPGDEGSAVERLQEQLQAKGYYTFPAITGYYGEETQQAVAKFQRASGLGSDGIAGKYTLRALFGSKLESVMQGATLYSQNGASSAIAEEQSQSDASSSGGSGSSGSSGSTSGESGSSGSSTGSSGGSESTVLKQGMTGSAVKAMQQCLVKLGYLKTADGDFGALTLTAVKLFQSGSGLLIDGEVGPVTLAALNASDAITYAMCKSKGITLPTGTGAQIAAYAQNFLGARYVYGTAGPVTFDCSGLTLYVFKHYGITLEHTTRKQVQMGSYVKQSDLKAGDLVFFDTVAGNGLAYDHVGIYISDGNFVHASSSGGVMISTLNSGYYKNTYSTARRLLN